MASVAVGIDLGTTNSVVAISEGGRPRVLAAPDGAVLIPSVVSFHPDGQVLVGNAARARRPVDPANTVFSVKRLLGRPFESEEVRRAAARFAFELREGPDAAILVHTRAGDMTLPEISALVLREIRRVAEGALGEGVDRAVVTVPANFNELQRTSTKVAGRIADLDVIRILNEPTAASLAYGYGRGTRERIAVYDFGGGTFDVTLLELSGNVFEVLATAGDTFLGGDDIDLLIAENLADAVLRALHIDARQDRRAYELLRAAAEQAKIELSTAEVATIRVPEIGYGPGGTPLEFKTRITRQDLERLATPLVARTFEVCNEALKLAGLRPQDFQNVILVGGTTRMPAVRERVAAFFGRDPLHSIPPEHVVAMGASVLAEALSGARHPRSAVPPASPKSAPPPVSAAPVAQPSANPVARMRGNTIVVGAAPPARSASAPPPQSVSARESGPASLPRTNTNPGLPAVGALPPARPSDLSWGSVARTNPPPSMDTLDAAGAPSTLDGKGLSAPYGVRASASSLPVPPPSPSGEEPTSPHISLASAAPVPVAPYARHVGATTAKMAAVLPPPVPVASATHEAQNARPASGPRLTESSLGFKAIEQPPPPAPLIDPYAPAAQTPLRAADGSSAQPLRASQAPVPAPLAALPFAAPMAPASAPPAGVAPPSRPAMSLAPFSVASAPAPPLLLDVTPLSLGVETVAGLCEVVIARNATIPVEQTREFATAYDGQDVVRIRIAQGESRRFADNQALGELELSGITPAPRGEVKIAVTFELDADGTLQVRARESATGRQTATRVALLTMPSAGEVADMAQRQRG